MIAVTSSSSDIATAKEKELGLHQVGDPPQVEVEQDLQGVPEELRDFYRTFATRDEEWRAYNTKKILRKLEIRLLPLLVLMYLLNFLDR